VYLKMTPRHTQERNLRVTTPAPIHTTVTKCLDTTTVGNMVSKMRHSVELHDPPL
jgi:hypothetical protein